MLRFPTRVVLNSLMISVSYQRDRYALSIPKKYILDLNFTVLRDIKY